LAAQDRVPQLRHSPTLFGGLARVR
jgi:hypothetical protein